MSKEGERLSLNALTPNEKGELVIVHREDEALVVHNEHEVSIAGTITAPRKFIEERGAKALNQQDAQQPVKRSNILYSYRGLYIKFTGNENHPLKYEISGQLKENPALKELQINTQKVFNSKQLSQHIRFNRYFFADREENLSLVSNLQSYRAQIQTEIEKTFDTTSGAKRDLAEIKVLEGKQPLGFNLMMPIYIGEEPVKFKVEIMVDIRDREVSFWLESPEVVDLLQSQAKAVIDRELKSFEGAGYVLIEQ